MSEPRFSRAALRWMIIGEWRAHPWRVALAAFAISIGVALGFAVHLINASALSEFDRAVRTVNGDFDLQVHATSPRGFAERLYPLLARLPGVARASPVVELSAQLGGGARITLLGLDVLRAGAVTPKLIGRPSTGQEEGFNPFSEQSLFLSAAALKASGRHVGDPATLTAAGETQGFTVAGDLPGVDDGRRIGVIDIAAAQWRFGQLGRLNRIDLSLDDGSDPARVAAAIKAILPVGAEIVTRQTEARRSDSLSRAYRVNLDMLALMALLTGAFLVFSAQSLSVARRRPQFALLRVLGVDRRTLMIQILIEASVVGGLGAVLGLGVGLGLAEAALRFLGGDLGGGYFAGASPRLIIAPGSAVVFGVLGLAAALAGSLLPAREAARSQPAVALKNLGDAIDPRARPPVGLAVALLAAGGAASLAPAILGLPILGYAAIALLLAGGVAAMPWLARVLLSPLNSAAIASPPLDLAVKRLWGAPSQAAIALCGIVASTSLMIAMAVMVSSFRGSVDEWLIQILPGDLYLTLDNAGSGVGFTPQARAGLAAAPGVASISFLQETSVSFAADKPPVTLIARDLSGPGDSLPLLGRGRAVPRGETPVWISEPLALLYGFRPGDHIVLPVGGVGSRVFVAGVWRDYARQNGAIAMESGAYDRLTGDTLRDGAAVMLRRGANQDGVIRALRGALPASLAAHLVIGHPRDIRARALSVFDRSFAITYLLEAIAIAVGLAGVAATISAQTIARVKEFGMLRHLGVRRRQISLMLAAEGALLGFVGGVAGLALGVVISQVLIHVINPQSFHWTMETHLPLTLFGGVAVSLIVASAGTALLAGGRAASADAVQAVREDW